MVTCEDCKAPTESKSDYPLCESCQDKADALGMLLSGIPLYFIKRIVSKDNLQYAIANYRSS